MACESEEIPQGGGGDAESARTTMSESLSRVAGYSSAITQSSARRAKLFAGSSLLDERISDLGVVEYRSHAVPQVMQNLILRS